LFIVVAFHSIAYVSKYSTISIVVNSQFWITFHFQNYGLYCIGMEVSMPIYSFVMGNTEQPQEATANGTSLHFDTAAQAANWVAQQIAADETQEERDELAAAQEAAKR
jgi:hypothetical protein